MQNVMKPTRTQVFAKPTLQQVLKSLRSEDFHVVKGDGIYYAYLDDTQDTLVLRAMNGTQGYLVTYTEKLLQPA